MDPVDPDSDPQHWFNDDIFVFSPSRLFPFFDEAHLEDFPLPVDFLAAALLTLQLGVHGLPLAVTFLNQWSYR